MNKETLKELIKSHFNLVEATKEEVAVEEKFAAVTLADGTELSNNQEGDFEVGQEVYVKDEAGEWIAAPEGEHTSESGIVLVVDAEGKLTGVHHPDSEGEGSLTEMAEEEGPAKEEIAAEIIEEAIAESVSPADVIEAVKAVIDEVVAPQIEEMKAKMAEMEKAYKAEPAAMSAQEKKFAAIENVKANKGEGRKFNAKAAQLEMIIKKAKK